MVSVSQIKAARSDLSTLITPRYESNSHKNELEITVDFLYTGLNERQLLNV